MSAQACLDLATAREAGRIAADLCTEKAERVARIAKLPKGQREWSQEEVERLRAIYPSCEALDVAEALGRGLNSIYTMAAKLGLKRKPVSSRGIPFTLDRLKQLLHYEPETGIFTWRVTRKGPVIAGRVAGSARKDGGRRFIGIDRRRYRASHLAWFYMHGCWPEKLIDHRNTNAADDSFKNLRAADHTLNAENKRQAQSNNRSTGMLGVSWHKECRKFAAYISTRGKRTYLGLFETAEAASAAYVAAKRELHEGCTL